jgi:hypothetical protein
MACGQRFRSRSSRGRASLSSSALLMPPQKRARKDSAARSCFWRNLCPAESRQIPWKWPKQFAMSLFKTRGPWRWRRLRCGRASAALPMTTRFEEPQTAARLLPGRRASQTDRDSSKFASATIRVRSSTTAYVRASQVSSALPLLSILVRHHRDLSSVEQILARRISGQCQFRRAGAQIRRCHRRDIRR